MLVVLIPLLPKIRLSQVETVVVRKQFKRNNGIEPKI